VSFIFLTRTLGLSPTAVGLIIAGGSGTVLLGAALTIRAVTTPLTFAGALAQPDWMVVSVVLGIASRRAGAAPFWSPVQCWPLLR
jgi:hypothetical protein